MIETIKNIRRQVEADTEGKWSARSVLVLLERALSSRTPPAPKVTEEIVVCPDCDGQKLMHGYDCDCPRCAATGVVPLGTAIRSILDDDDADVFEKLADIRSALTASGYRILGPDELDAVTVEKCAAVAWNATISTRNHPHDAFRDEPIIHREIIATAIRTLTAAPKEEGR